MEGREGDLFLLRFLGDRTALDILENHGHMPLPPYIDRADNTADRERYQTVYAEKPGAAAAPTAGLHFDQALLDQLRAKGVDFAFVTLHVGAGTFLPVKADDTAEHRMHSEIGHVSAETAAALNQVRAKRRTHRVCRHHLAYGCWKALRLRKTARYQAWSGPTDIFITPGYAFSAVDVLMTNFHLPRSTLFMLVSAFSGLETMRAAYDHAIETGYRFYSYGDSSLLFRSDQR